MSSSNSERLTSSVSESASIPEMIKQFKNTFLEREFKDFESKLMKREQKLESKIENLTRDCDLTKEKVHQLERTQGLAVLEKLKLEEKLQTSQRKCEELNERITRLIEEQKVSSNREKRAEERYAKMSKENVKITNEKNELNVKIKELKNKNAESEQLVGVYQDKCKDLETKLLKMALENDDLRHEKSAANLTVEQYKGKQLVTNQVVEELKRKNSEATQIVDELRLKKMESDKAAESYKTRFENLAPRIGKLEEELAKVMKNVKMEELGNLVDIGNKHAFEEGNVNFPDCKGENVISGNDNNQDDAEDIVKKGGGRLFQSSSKEGFSNTVHSNAADQDKECKEPHGSDIESKGLEGSGPHGRRQRMFGAECSNRFTRPAAPINIIELSDSDDETNPSGSAKGANVGKNETVSDKFVQSPSSNWTNKRSRTDDRMDLTAKKTRYVDKLPVYEKESQVRGLTENRTGRSLFKDLSEARDSQTPQKINGLVDSTDSEDESCSDSHIDNILSALRSKNNSRVP